LVAVLKQANFLWESRGVISCLITKMEEKKYEKVVIADLDQGQLL